MERNKTSRTTDESASDDGSVSRREVLALLGMLGLGGSIDAVAQDAAKASPRSYLVVLENDKVRVLEYRSRPGLSVCGQGKHWHPAHLSIVMEGGKAKEVDVSGNVHTHNAKAGDVFWAPAETHSVENISGRQMRAYMVEFKDKDWAPSTG